MQDPIFPCFDRITRLAALSFGVPAAQVALSAFPELADGARPTAFCRHALARDEMLVVEDTLRDPRFAGDPPVSGAPAVRFYAGQPLRLDGQPVGTLYLIDHAPRAFTARQRQALADLAALAETELRLAESEQGLRTVTDNLPVLVAQLDSRRRYVFANAVHQSWLGQPAAQILGKTMEEAFGAGYFAPQAAALAQAWSGQAAQCEHEIVRKKHTRIAHTTFLPQLRGGRVMGVTVLTVDATVSRMHERSLHALAHTDTLTGLPNRRHLETVLPRARRGVRPGCATALLYLDIDGFKRINERHGHAAGDAVLAGFARRLGTAVGPGVLAVRLAGDAFAVLLDEVAGEAEIEAMARRILDAMRPPFALDSVTLQVGTAVGAVLAAKHDTAPDLAPERLMGAASRALHLARETGHHGYALLRLGRSRLEAPELAHG